MKQIVLILSVLALSVSLAAQPVMKFREMDHNFGTFKEEAGKQSFDFVFTNTGTAPLVIQQVVASCGCTTPQWTKEPVPSGGQGKITVTYDPAGRPNQFEKTINVYSNSKPEVQVLKIKGSVIAKELSVEDIFTFPVDSIRFESNHLAFTNVKKTEKKIRVMQMINTSHKPVKVEFVQTQPYLTLKANPEVLKPGQKGIVEGTYDATKNNNWGMVSDMVKVKLNGVTAENVYYYVSANLVEDFSQLSREQLENAPVFKAEATTIDLGKIPGSTNKEVEFKYTNTGKSVLYIRNVRPSCGCTALQQGVQGAPIKPGQTSSIKATFNSGSYNGKVTKAIYVFTNDPKNSEVILMFNAEVIQPGASN